MFYKEKCVRKLSYYDTDIYTVRYIYTYSYLFLPLNISSFCRVLAQIEIFVMIVIDFENRYLHGYLMDLDDFLFFGKPLIWIFTIFWIRTRTVPRKFFKMSLTLAKIENIAKSKIFFRSVDFFVKKKLFLIFFIFWK